MDVGEVAQIIGWQGGPIVCVYLPLIIPTIYLFFTFAVLTFPYI